MLKNNIECKIQEFIDTEINTSISWFLLLSYHYYHKNESLVTDSFYDELSKFILDRWGNIKHPHKNLITKENLKCGSLYNLKEEDYPIILKQPVENLYWSVR